MKFLELFSKRSEKPDVGSVVESSARVVEASKELSKRSNELEEMLAKHEDVFGNMVRTMKGKKRK